MKTLIAQFETFQWFDVIDPKIEDLRALSQEFKIPLSLLKDCLDPVKLPKLEKVMGIQFYLFRIYDKKSSPEADTVLTLTRKIAVFIGPQFFLTIHRLPQKEISEFSEKCLSHFLEYSQHAVTQLVVMIKLIEVGLRGYLEPMQAAEEQLDEFEGKLFAKQFDIDNFQKLHRHRRQLSLFKRLLLHSQDLVLRTTVGDDFEKILLEDLKETLHHLIFFADELLEDTTSLLSLQLSLASQRTNDVMRVLTLFSVFFMPLTFIVGIYGMNFHVMPELSWDYGYYSVWAMMIVISIAIWLWFRKRGWIGSQNGL